jgi:hypothetical protein
MKLRVGLTVAMLGLSSSALLAQGEVTTGAAGVNAPAAALSFNPYIMTGLHGTQANQAKNGTYTGGVFITPSFETGYKSPSLKVGLVYEPQITSGRGFGDTTDKSIGGNTYIEHHPTFTINGGPSRLKFNGVVDAIITMNQAAAKSGENKTDLSIIPGVEYWVDPTFAITADAWVQRVTYFDTTNVDGGLAGSIKSSTAADAPAKKAALEKTKTAADFSSVGSEPTTTLYAGAIGIKKSFSETLKLTSYIRAGHRASNYTEGDAKYYRAHAHLDFATPVANLSGFVRLRLNVYDAKAGEITYQPYDLVQLSYDLGSGWSVFAQNEMAITKDTTGAGKPVSVENENYLGATYKF